MRCSNFRLFAVLAVLGLVLMSLTAGAQQKTPDRGRKYKAPRPPRALRSPWCATSTASPSRMPPSSSTMKGERDKGNMELKTNEDGKAVIDVLNIGYTVRLQIIAKGFQTFGDDYKIDKPQIAIDIRMKRPGGQYSIYMDHPEKPHGGKSPDAPLLRRRTSPQLSRMRSLVPSPSRSRAVCTQSRAMPTKPLDGKSALVTGGARRVGRGIALALAEAGADVVLTYRNSRDEAVETAREIESLGRRALAVECDMRSEASVRSAVAAAVGRFGRLNLVVNNAAVFESAPLDSLTLEQWDAVFETNARGPFLVAREAMPHLRAAEGRIINIGSLGGMKAWAGHAHYCASKAALHMLTQAMAKAFAPEVSVNCVAPGWIELDGKPSGRLRILPPKRPCGATAAWKTWPRRFSSLPQGRTSSLARCWPWMAGWGCREKVPYPEELLGPLAGDWSIGKG